MVQPNQKIPQRLGEEQWSETEPGVARVVRPAVHQQQQPDFLLLLPQLPRHLVSNIAAETITTQVIRPLRLKPAQVMHVAGGHIFDPRKLFQSVRATRSE